ncbi:DNA-directed DNA polymerase, partial [Methanobacterium aggregans]
METRKFVLLDIDYITEDDRAVVRLFGKLQGNENGRSVIAVDKGFKPYIYVLPHEPEECVNDINELDVEGVEWTRKNDIGHVKDFLKVTLKHPQDVPKLRDKIRNLDSVDDIREHDIPFYRRYLIDKGLFPMAEVEVDGEFVGEEDCSFRCADDTCVFEIEGEARPVESEFPDLKILSFDIEVYNPEGMPQAEVDKIIMISLSSNQGLEKVVSTKESELDFVETVENEEKMLERFVEIVKSENPDLLIGYNSDNFDMPYINDRADKIGVKMDMGTDGSKLKFMRRGFANAGLIKGRIHVDLYLLMRRYLTLDRYTLERVYRELFDEEKEDVPGDEIYQYWDDGGEKLDTLFRYSLDDAVAVTKIGEKMLPLSLELTRIVGQPFFDIARMTTGQMVEWYLIRKAYEYGDIVPNKPSSTQYSERRGKRAAGGYVKDPVKGLHENIVSFDFRSLYPSIIISKNVSPDTLVSECSEDECYIAPEVGHKFLKEPVGFVPSIIGNILRERVRIKTMMKASENPREKQILDVQQQALKRLANSMYGVYGYSRFRWYRIECAEAVTAWGRDFIKKTMKHAEEYGFRAIYADT